MSEPKNPADYPANIFVSGLDSQRPSNQRDTVVRVVYWKTNERFPYANWMPRSWIDRVMANEGAIRWRICR